MRLKFLFILNNLVEGFADNKNGFKENLCPLISIFIDKKYLLDLNDLMGNLRLFRPIISTLGVPLGSGYGHFVAK
jgi:hypothetical protein